jgi:hypothetical protein
MQRANASESEDLRRRISCPALQAQARGQAQEQAQEQEQEQEQEQVQRQSPPMQSAWCKASSPSASMSETTDCCMAYDMPLRTTAGRLMCLSQRPTSASPMVMQAEAKRQKQLPTVFSTPWLGGGDVDRRRPIPLAIILNEIERDQNDGQDARGAPIDDGGGQDEVEDAVPTPTLRRGPARGRGGAGQTDFELVVSEAVRAAMVAVERSKRQGASASAMLELRADFEEEEEEEEEEGAGGRGRQLQRREGGRR